MSSWFGVRLNHQGDRMTVKSSKTQGEMSDDNQHSDNDSLSVNSDSVIEESASQPITGAEGAKEIEPYEASSANSFRLDRTLFGLGIFALLTVAILAVTKHLNPASSMAGMEGMDHGDMSHDEMMAVDGSFNPNP
ncbi:MAG: hypothetical protein WBM86_17635, partial [Waterburya sp.]